MIVLKLFVIMSLKIKNNYTLITGATSDLGLHICDLIGKDNNLLIQGRDSSRLEKIKKIIKFKKKKVLIWEQDFKNFNDISVNLEKIFSKNKIKIDNFIHCAGFSRILPIRNFNKNLYDEIFNINFFSALEIIRVLVKKNNLKFLKNILFISAFYSKFGSKYNSIYASSKGAIDSVVKSLALELAPIRVNSILPGAIRTRMSNNLFNNKIYFEEFKKRYLLGEANKLSIPETVMFLLSANCWITGQNIRVDGGASCH